MSIHRSPDSTMVCSICYERFTAPVALPCGHIFCTECIRRAVDTSQMNPLKHSCPTCRSAYSVGKFFCWNCLSNMEADDSFQVSIDPALVPAYIRPHILPVLRPIFFDDPSLESSPATSSDSACLASLSASAIEDLITSKSATDPSIEALRRNCVTWRRRAEVHAANNAGLLGFARVAKEYTLCMRAERDDALGHCAILQRKLEELTVTVSSPVSEPRGYKRSGDECRSTGV
ncbi:hypothetical protein R3P38DRAFT_1062084 [Favolaschia claudopus]|uniref:RING-type domain-containing protein n=1 Tax=Favolaschia claudopus TaxID=2862362 RepID=A0AAW0BFV3_9AGAR